MATSTGLVTRTHPAFVRWRAWGAGWHGRVTDAWTAILAEDPNLRRVEVCVEAVFGGDHVVRFATGPVRSVSGRDGTEYVYRPVRMGWPTLDQSYALGSGSAPVRSIAMSVPNALVGIEGLVGSGRALAGFGEVSLQVDGMDYDDRLVLMRGDMDDGVVYSPGDGGMVEFSLTDPKDHADLNLSQWVASPERNGVLISDSAVGQRYPLIFNRYVVPCLQIVRVAAAPTYLVAYGHGHAVIAVYVNGESRDSSDVEYGYTQENDLDEFGVPYRKLYVSGDHAWDGSETVHADTTAASPAATDLLGIVRYLLAQFTTLGESGLNDELFGLAQARLGPNATIRALVNGSGEGTETRAIQYVESELLSSFPMVSMAWHGGGYGPVVTDHRSTLVRARLVVGQHPILDRTSDVQETPKSELFNNFTFRYAYSMIDDEFGGVVVRHPDNSPLCSLSRDNVGERHMDPIESVTVFDSAVATYIVDWLVAHYAMPSYYVEYQAMPVIYLTLRPGDNVRITDDELGWDEVPATVERLALVPGGAVLGLRVWWSYYRLGGGALTHAGV